MTKIWPAHAATHHPISIQKGSDSGLNPPRLHHISNACTGYVESPWPHDLQSLQCSASSRSPHNWYLHNVHLSLSLSLWITFYLSWTNFLKMVITSEWLVFIHIWFLTVILCIEMFWKPASLVLSQCNNSQSVHSSVISQYKQADNICHYQ